MPVTLELGQTVPLGGDVTRMTEIQGRSPRNLEASLGFGVGRLYAGYWVALLVEKLQPGDILFGGLTLRSGGREGLPRSDPMADRARVHVHDRMMKEYGAAGVSQLQRGLADDAANLAGPGRIAKVLPRTGHKGENPAVEYPPGRGGPQWTIKARRFFIAAVVGPDAVATTADGWTVSLADAAPYDGRAKFVRYLEGWRPSA